MMHFLRSIERKTDCYLARMSEFQKLELPVLVRKACTYMPPYLVDAQ